MPINAYAVPSTTVGLAKEVTRGTAVAPAFWAKVKSPKYKPDLTVIEDSTLQGSMVSIYNQVPGMRYDSHGWDTMPYLDMFPLYLTAEFGSADTVATAPTSTTLSSPATVNSATISTAASVAANSWITIGAGQTLETHYTTAVSGAGPYSVTLQYPVLFAQSSGAAVAGLTGHSFSLLNNTSSTGNQPPSLTVTDFDGEEWRQMTGCQMDKLSIKGNDQGFVDCSVDFLGNAAVTPTPPTASFTSTTATPGWTTLISIGGTAITYVEDWEFSFARGTKPIPALTGTQAYPMYFAGPLTCTGKITVVEQTAAPELTKYLAGTQSSLDITISDRATGFGMRMHSTTTAFKTGELVRGKEWVEATLDFQLLPSSTDATAGGVSPINISVGNAQTASF